MKDKICQLIELKIATLSDLEQYALLTLKQKLINDELAYDERSLLVNDFISNYLEFDGITGEPTGETVELESMIDYLIY